MNETKTDAIRKNPYFIKKIIIGFGDIWFGMCDMRAKRDVYCISVVAHCGSFVFYCFE